MNKMSRAALQNAIKRTQQTGQAIDGVIYILNWFNYKPDTTFQPRPDLDVMTYFKKWARHNGLEV